MTSGEQDSWYEVTEGRELEQGDLLFQCPLIVPKPAIKSTAALGNDVTIKVSLFDVIVLTQSCDLVNGKLSDVTLCAHWNAESVAQDAPNFSKTTLAEIKNGRRPRYTLLNRSALPNPQMGLRIVDCGKVFCLPLDSVQELAVRQGPRLRLRSPYREHLSQAFARFFMRVGLPQDIQI